MPVKQKPLAQRRAEAERELFDRTPLPFMPYTTAKRWFAHWKHSIDTGEGLKQISKKRFRRSMQHWINHVHGPLNPPLWLLPKRGESDATLVLPFWIRRLIREATPILEFLNSPELQPQFGGEVGLLDYIDIMADAEMPHFVYLADEPANKEELAQRHIYWPEHRALIV